MGEHGSSIFQNNSKDYALSCVSRMSCFLHHHKDNDFIYNYVGMEGSREGRGTDGGNRNI